MQLRNSEGMKRDFFSFSQGKTWWKPQPSRLGDKKILEKSQRIHWNFIWASVKNTCTINHGMIKSFDRVHY